jgi:hypothetical protein
MFLFRYGTDGTYKTASPAAMAQLLEEEQFGSDDGDGVVLTEPRAFAAEGAFIQIEFRCGDGNVLNILHFHPEE